LHDAANNHHGGGAHGGSVRGGDGAHDGAATTTPEVNLVEMTGKTVDAEVKRLLSGFEPAKVDEALKVYHEAMKSGNYDRATEILKAASKASGNDNFESSELFKMHRDHLNTIMGNAATHIDDMAAKVEPAGYTHQIQGSAHRTLFGYQKEQTAVPIDDDRPVSSPRAFGQAAQKLQEEMPNKSRFSLEDNQGNSAKVHIKNDGDMKIKGKYFDAEGNPYKQTTTIDAQTGIEESKYSGATVPGNTVGANGEDDVVVKAISHAKGRMQIIKDGAATTDEGGRTDLYDGGSSKHHDFYTVKYDESGKRIEVSAPMTEKAANAALKAYKESLTQGGK
ncbi:MAG: hypothetical protein J6Y91_03150, partial [Alphaproteobacteria bacterium]|nr:hypothetical protein [Alphaproteobacteria bacterium]